jgi:hypothetical protein
MTGIKPKVRIRNINLRTQKQGQLLRNYKRNGDCVNPDIPEDEQVCRPESH